jgi:hypothetical protein
MEKVVQPKKVIKLTDAEKKVLSAYINENSLNTMHPAMTDKKVVKNFN